MTTAQIYIFSIFVFILLCALILIWCLVARARGRSAPSSIDEAAAKEKEERLFRLYQNIEEMMDNFEAYIEDSREEVESVRRQMQLQAEGINEMIKRVELAEASARESLAALHAKDAQEPPAKSAAAAEEPQEVRTGKQATKQERVRELLERGLAPVQIAKKLEISVNEVKLIAYGLSKRGELDRMDGQQVLDVLRAVDAQMPEQYVAPESQNAPEKHAVPETHTAPEPFTAPQPYIAPERDITPPTVGKHEAKRNIPLPERPPATALDPKRIWQDAVPAAQEPPEEQPEPRKDIRMDPRYEAVRKLLGKGYTIKQIAKKMKLSVYEVRLIVYGMAKK